MRRVYTRRDQRAFEIEPEPVPERYLAAIDPLPESRRTQRR